MSSVDTPRTDEYSLFLSRDASDMVLLLPVFVARIEGSRARPNNVDEGKGPAGALPTLSMVSFAVSRLFDKLDDDNLLLRSLHWVAPFSFPKSIKVCVKLEAASCKSG